MTFRLFLSLGLENNHENQNYTYVRANQRCIVCAKLVKKKKRDFADPD